MIVTNDAELELGVGQDDTSRLCVSGRFGVESDGGGRHALSEICADDLVDFVGVNVLVVFALVGFGAWGEERSVGNLLGFLQTCCEFDAVNGSDALVFSPTTAGDVSSDDSFDGQHFGSLDKHRPTLDLVFDAVELVLQLSREVSVVGSNDVRLDKGGCQETEPESGKGMEKLALVGNALWWCSAMQGASVKAV